MRYATDAGELKKGHYVIAYCCLDYPNSSSMVIKAADNNQAEYEAVKFCIASCSDAASIVTDSEYAIRMFNEECPNSPIKVSWISRLFNSANAIVRGRKELLRKKLKYI